MKQMDEKATLALAQRLITLYMSRRDVRGLLEQMEERTSWIGTGEDEINHSLREIEKTLTEEIEEYGGKFAIEETKLTYMPVRQPGAVVYGTIKAVPEDPMLSNEELRFSGVAEQTEDGLKILHIHASHSDFAQEQGEYFVRRNMREDNRSLRQELNMRERQLANLTKNIPGGAHQCLRNASFTLISMSDGFLSMFGYTKEEVEQLFDGKFINMIYPGDRAGMLKSTYEQLEKGTEIEVEYRVLCKNGQPLWVLDKGRLIDDGNGSSCFYCLLIDITQRKRQEEELRLSLERHQVIMNQATDIIFEWNISSDTMEFSPNWKKKFGYDPIDTDISRCIPCSDNIHKDDMAVFRKLMRDTAAGVPYSEAEFRIRDMEGQFYWCRIRATVQYDGDKCPVKAVGVIVDIDEEKKQKQVLMRQARFDALTGIYNKATISTMVENVLRERERQPAGYEALLIIDVDHFKAVNDNYGHLCGDSVLSDVAAAIKGTSGPGALVGRIGGDEFLVYLPDAGDEKQILHKTEQILAAVNCIRPDYGTPPISCSMGAAFKLRDGMDFHTFYEYADRALYQQKNCGRGWVTLLDADACEAEPEKEPVTSAVGNIIVSDEVNVADEWLAQYAFRMLYEARDIEEAIDRLLEITGRSFDVSRVYIFENSVDGTCCSNTFEWCNEGAAPQKELLQNISYERDLDGYLKYFNDQGIFYCHDIQCLSTKVYEILKPQEIRSMLQCAMLDEGEFVGYVGFDECRVNREWSQRQMASFKLVADVLSTFLLKLRQKQKKLPAPSK